MSTASQYLQMPQPTTFPPPPPPPPPPSPTPSPTTPAGLEVLRLFPGLTTPLDLWHDLAPVSRLVKLKELQLVGYSPIKFSRGAATGAQRLSYSFSGLPHGYHTACKQTAQVLFSAAAAS
jgi:hypothetical protein